MHGLVILDAEGRPLRPAILWNDQRSHVECQEITEMLGADYLYQHIGSAMLPCFFTPKLLWIKKNEPLIYHKIAHVLLVKDYIRYRLSGAYISDVADASGMGLMEIAKRTWSQHILSTLDIPQNWLPTLCESPEIASTVSTTGAAATQLLAGIPIVGGAGDQPAQSIGSGVDGPHKVSMAIGTSGVVFTVNDAYHPEPQGRLNTFCHAIPNTWFHMGVTLSAAGSFEWFRNTLAPKTPYAELDQLAQIIPVGSNGLLFTPYLSGERHPHADPLVRASFVGLTLRHNLGHMARAVMEGVAFSLKDVMELFYQNGIKPTAITVSGGAANSPLWRQIIADVIGLPLYVVNTNEGAALGAAVLAAVGCKAYPSVKDACQHMILRSPSAQPIASHVEQYNQVYAVYRQLYPLLRETCVDLASIEQQGIEGKRDI